MILRRVLACVAALALVMTACGGSDDVDTTATAGSTAGSPSVVEVGEQNQTLLQSAEDARDVEVLDVSDGSIATLRDAVDGDRAVLLWFHAPH